MGLSRFIAFWRLNRLGKGMLDWSELLVTLRVAITLNFNRKENVDGLITM